VSYVFHPAAEIEHIESVAYFESKRPGLGASYLSEFEGVMVQVCEAPHRYPIEKESGIRRIKMKHFPFTVYFHKPSGSIQVLAVAHHRRRPGYWLGRRKGMGTK